MDRFIQQVVDGLSSGSIYAALALALVLVYRASGVVNFAQGEMGMLGAFAAWQLNSWGLPVWVAIPVAAAIAFVGGGALYWGAIRPVATASPLTVVIITIGLLLVFNNGAAWVWGASIKEFPTVLPDRSWSVGGAAVTAHSIGVVVCLVVVVVGLRVLFNHTKIGLAMRAATDNAESSRLSAIPVTRVFVLAWALAAALGTLAGCLIAPRLFLEPNMMLGVQIYALAGATLGGFASPGGAILGGLAIGVGENLAGSYIGFIGADLKIGVALAAIFVVLLIRPAGLFGLDRVVRA
jgi:branched-chain amino acid transport system permease protein